VVEREQEPAASDESVDSGRLMILVSDASGFASFKSHRFSDAGTAAEFLSTWYGRRLDKDNGIIAFWAMTERPAAAPGLDVAAIEAIVVVRDAGNDEVVYPFSFVDLGEALAFVRFELDRGVDPALIEVYWAVPVQMGVTGDGKVRIYPEEPPKGAAGQPGAPAETITCESPAAELIGWSEPSDKDDPMELMLMPTRRWAGPQNGGFLMSKVEEEVIEAAEAVTRDTFEKVEVVEVVAEKIAFEKIEPAEEIASEGALVDVAPAEDIEAEDAVAAAEESGAALAVEAPARLEGDHTEEGADTAEAVESEAEQPKASVQVEEEPISVEAGVEATEATQAPSLNGKAGGAMNGRPGNGRSSDELLDLPQVPLTVEPKEAREPAGFEFPAGRASLDSGRHVDAKEELQKVLKVRRWDEREGPFSGFDSPPGRF
jgi:hypothetical protein